MEDEAGPGFGYSIGLYKTFGYPEILIVGLNLDLIHQLINDIGELVRSDKRPSIHQFNSDILDNFSCYFTTVDVEHYEEYVQQAINYYRGEEFPLVQCIYPTVKGVFPWEKEWPEDIKALQPILGPIAV
jgi:hypothetical protein